jgi:hypothetical protein
MGDAMVGQRYVDVTGLPLVLTPKRMASHYHQLFKRGVLALKDSSGNGVGNVGLAMRFILIPRLVLATVSICINLKSGLEFRTAPPPICTTVGKI